MYAEVRELLETYELNTTHLVVKSGTVADGKLVCDPNGIHVGDNTQYGKITNIDLDIVTCENAIEASPLKVQVYDYVTDNFIDKTYDEQVTRGAGLRTRTRK